MFPAHAGVILKKESIRRKNPCVPRACGGDPKRVKQINLDHTHKGMKLHTHHGYFHNENDSLKGASKLSKEEKAMVERITKLWDNKKGK